MPDPFPEQRDYGRERPLRGCLVGLAITAAVVSVGVFACRAARAEGANSGSAAMLPRAYKTLIKDEVVVVRYAVQTAQACADVGGKAARGATIVACQPSWPVPYIILPHPCLNLFDDAGKIGCHELMHKLGWPADHPADWRPAAALSHASTASNGDTK